MAGKNNEAFEKAWNLYTNEKDRESMKKNLPGVYALFSSGNKLQAEQEFNAELKAFLTPAKDVNGNPINNGYSILADELAWAAAGKIPDVPVSVIKNGGREYSGSKNFTKEKLKILRKNGIQYFAEHPEEHENAESYPGKVQQFVANGISEELAKIYALPTEKFKQLAQDMDTKAGMIYTGKDNKRRHVADAFYDAGYKPDEMITEDPVEKKEKSRKFLSHLVRGNLSEVSTEDENIDALEQYAKDNGFVNSDALLDYLAVSFDRSNRLREQDDDNWLTKAAKGIAISNINKKWNEGVPANTKDIAHDVIDDALVVVPQDKIYKAVRYSPMVMRALSSGGKLAPVSRAVNNPWLQLAVSNAVVPMESAYVESLLNGNEDGIDWGNVGFNTAASMSAEGLLGAALKTFTNKTLPVKSYKTGDFTKTKKEVIDDLERRAYEIAKEKQTADAFHNAMVDFKYGDRTPSTLFGFLNTDKKFKRYGLNEDQFDRAFDNAYRSARQKHAVKDAPESRDLSFALRDFSKYKKTDDFKNAVEAAAWESAGLEAPLVLDILRTRRNSTPNKAKEVIDELVDKSKSVSPSRQGRLMDLFNDYHESSPLKKFFAYEAFPLIKNMVKNGMVVENTVEDIPIRGLTGIKRFLPTLDDKKK